MHSQLSKAQKEAVMHKDGPMMVLAGPGSGKTLVITKRIQYLISHYQIPPQRILVITFTRAAANEMKERFWRLAGETLPVSFGTFHSVFFTILKYAYHYSADNILPEHKKYDFIREIITDHELEIDDEADFMRQIIQEISLVKGQMIYLAYYHSGCCGDEVFKEIYRAYEEKLHENRWIDFDDILVYTYELLKEREDIRKAWQQKFPYILIDEFQDINKIQYEIVKMLAGETKNLFIVGDDDQSIYKFRGANIYNILNFEHHFPDATVIKLEQNYRSTQNILDAANAVIANNQGRKEKRLWTDNGAGDKITFEQLDTAAEEADFVARDIARRVRKGEYQYKDCAILYRTNAQSRLFEERFITANIPYKIFGGVNFYARKEVKDLLAYLKTIDNGQDDLAVRRIINIPKRGIGAASINKVALYAQEQEISFYDALCVAEQVPGLGKAAAKIRPFVLFIQSMKAKAKLLSVADLLQEVIETTGYVRELEAEGTDEAEARIENIDELISKAVDYAEGEEAPTLNGFLENVALVADIDSFDENSDYVVLMTLHSAKGLEFPNVYLAGLEDGLFPSYMSITSDNSQAEIEEERRLAYVGITRAKKNLTITSARVRMVRGQTQYGKVSRFVREIPPELLSGKIYEPKTKEEPIEQSTFQKARKAFRTVPSYGGSGYGKEVGEGYGSTFRSSKATKPVYTKVENQRDFGSAGGALFYQVGDRVRHIKFGDGEVMAIVSGGRDYEVTVDFDKVGTKKMFASFAKLKKI